MSTREFRYKMCHKYYILRHEIKSKLLVTISLKANFNIISTNRITTLDRFLIRGDMQPFTYSQPSTNHFEKYLGRVKKFVKECGYEMIENIEIDGDMII